MKLFVCVDVSSEDLKVCIMDCDGNSLKKFAVQNNPAGASFLRDQIISLVDKHSCKEIHIGMESTSVYSFHPAMFLNEDEDLRKYRTKVFCY